MSGWVVPSEVRSSARRVRSRSPLTPADGHHRCFWLRRRPRRAPCACRHRASTPVRRAACCADAFLWLSSRAFCVPAGGRACVVMMCHCVRHISLDNKHGRSVEAIHSSRHVGRPARSSVPAHGKSRAARRALWGARSVILRCNLKSIATRSIPHKGKRSLELVDILRIDCSSRIAACRVRGAERLRVLDESCELRGQTWGELTASRRTSETWVSTSGSSRSP